MKKKSAYFVGIKGVAMTALAVYLKEKGYEISGSDVIDKFATDVVLQKNHIKVQTGFKAENLDKKYDLVVVTGAHGGMTNPEARRAKELCLPTFMHGELLGKLMEEKEGISVAGCHGKTTTSALIASLLIHAGLDPSYAIGVAEINNLGWNGHYGKGKYFIAEADEYMTCPLTCPTPRFLWQKPKILVITNIEFDHPDAFSDITKVREAFIKLTANIVDNGTLVACIDNENVRKILPLVKRQVVTYGFSPNADYRIDKFYYGEGISFMRISTKGISLGEFMLKISGKHNLLNALAASVAANLIGISWEKIKGNLKLFTGTKRRLEKIGQVGQIQLYDDYAHHPSEITATLAGIKEWFPNKRLIVIFQPHTYSRTRALLNEFAQSFGKADFALITDIYPSARESFDPTIKSPMLVMEANKYKKNAVYLPTKEKVIDFLEKKVSDNDLILTMGAGDIFLWHADILKLLKKMA